eukprot:TRINITY_DN14449_c0_g1_i1.p1 TRINITY_DN14449_c0_g1~~TRINITY_DN14449_c0_g1_i1.p1  ORF type:complete len:618 (-),score=87.73 TRINITY_DN14449_c0_g1_i1:497-2350(-)
MKHLRPILACLLATPVVSVLTRQRTGLQTQTNDCGCPGNQFPSACDGTYQADGLRLWRDLWNVDSLRTAQNSHWKHGRNWYLSVKVTSADELEQEFAFGGRGKDGSLVIKVKPGVINQTITVNGSVGGTSDDTIFQYRGPVGKVPKKLKHLADHVRYINFTNVCLRPKLCKEYTCSDYSRMKLTTDATKFGNTDNECCDIARCSDFQCLPATQWTAKSDAATRDGREHHLCCDPILCKDQPESLCPAATHFPIALHGSGLRGSTQDECCEETKCILRGCSSDTKWKLKADAVNITGRQDTMCCDPIHCANYTCKDPKKKLNLTLAALTTEEGQGSSDEECCVDSLCKDYTCSDSTKWESWNITDETAKDKSFKGNITGFGDERCCKPKYCKDFKCPKKTHDPILGRKGFLGSTAEQCCIPKTCDNYKCSDPLKWVKASVQAGGNGDKVRRGSTDAECCTKLKCTDHICTPLTQWTVKNSTELEDGNLQGSTNELCCNPVYCESYTCSAATKWYKKVDTNSFKFQGKTDEECCQPKYCRDYFTRWPTKWERKINGNGTVDELAVGSTDEECYTPLFCSAYSCVDETKMLVPNSQTLRGSTDEECCISRSTLPRRRRSR